VAQLPPHLLDHLHLFNSDGQRLGSRLGGADGGLSCILGYRSVVFGRNASLLCRVPTLFQVLAREIPRLTMPFSGLATLLCKLSQPFAVQPWSIACIRVPTRRHG
jgi:hypothetical protein